MAIIPLAEFRSFVRQIGDKASRAMLLTIQDATKEAHREAIANAPRSPTQTQIGKAQKAKYVAKHGSAQGYAKHKAAAMARRRPNSHSRPAPGGLEKSIKYKIIGTKEPDGMIYVARNAPAGKYAAKIHDEKGKTWRKRGLGTQRKGARADDKYILRAVEKVAATLIDRYNKIYERLK